VVVAPAIGWAFSYKIGRGEIGRWFAGVRGSDEGKREVQTEPVDETHADDTAFTHRLRGSGLRRRLRSAQQENGGEEV